MKIAGVAQWQSSWFVISRLLVRLRSPAPYMGAFPSGQRGQTVNLLSVTSVVRIHPLPPEKSTHLSTKTMCAFFNEIRLRRVKYGFAMWNSYAVKYLLRKCEEANFISHCDEGAIFHNSRSELFHIRRETNISLEKLYVLWYNKATKGGVIMAESKLRDLSTDFAVKVIKMCDGIKGHYSLVNQLERSSTSIGANIHEAKNTI